MTELYSKAAVFRIFLFPALGGFLFGYDIGATSFVLTQLENENYAGVAFSHAVRDSPFLQGAITSSGVGGALIGSVIVFRVAESIGRRRELLIASVLYIFGALIEALSAHRKFAWLCTRVLITL